MGRKWKMGTKLSRYISIILLHKGSCPLKKDVSWEAKIGKYGECTPLVQEETEVLSRYLLTNLTQDSSACLSRKDCCKSTEKLSYVSRST